MKTSLVTLALALTALAAAPAAGQQPPPEDPLARHLFPPELVMQHQRAIGLRPEQRAAITQAIQRLQARVVELQWSMQEEQQRLVELLQRPAVDSTAALGQIDRLLGVEREVKRAHLALLIQIKNTLSPQQQERLNALRP